MSHSRCQCPGGRIFLRVGIDQVTVSLIFILRTNQFQHFKFYKSTKLLHFPFAKICIRTFKNDVKNQVAQRSTSHCGYSYSSSIHHPSPCFAFYYSLLRQLKDIIHHGRSTLARSAVDNKFVSNILSIGNGNFYLKHNQNKFEKKTSFCILSFLAT